MIEVTDEDVKAVMQVVCEVYKCKCDLKHQDCQCWEWAEPSDIIAAAYEVMWKKHKDDLAEAVKEVMQQTQKDKVVIEFCGFGDECLVDVVNRQTRKNVTRSISLDDNFPALAAAAVRDLAKQVRQCR